MIAFPNSKINLGLHITRKRNDGFHDIETVFYPLPLYDALEIISTKNNTEEFSFSTSGTTISGNANDNLCSKAFLLIKNEFPAISSIQLHLHKNIPMGAGLGGGSADGAFTLKLLNEKFGLGLSTKQLINYALQLGSDCPFFIINKPCYATGRGEVLEPIDLDLSNYTFILINPGIHVDTRIAFSEISPAPPLLSTRDIVKLPITEWRGQLKNDFEKTVFNKYPEIQKIKEELYHAGAIYASMTGSGSTVFGVFEQHHVPALSFPAHYYIKELKG